jgi:hypothetical protein
MDYNELQRIIAATDASYAAASAPQVGGGGMLATSGPNTAGMQAAVAARESAVQAYQSGQQSQRASSDGGGGGGGGGYSPPPPPPAPLLPVFVPITSSITAIKQAPIDTVVFNEDTVSIQQLTELLYEQIGGMELINIAREDTVSGQDVIYSPISNISSIWGQFNPNNVIAVGSSFDTFFSRFAIDLILRGMNIPYFNEDGDLIIEIDDVLSDEEIHYQIASSGTINEVDI